MPEDDKNPEKEQDKEEAGAQGEAGEGEEGEGEGAAKPKSKKKVIIIAVVVLLVVLGGAGGALFFLGIIPGSGSGSVPLAADGEEGLPINEDGIIEATVYYDMEEFVVNLNIGSQRPSFLKMTVSLELPGQSHIPVIEDKMPRIRDSFQVYIRELRQDDLQGSAGMYRLREELLLRINKIVYPAKVNDILFKEILVQ